MRRVLPIALALLLSACPRGQEGEGGAQREPQSTSTSVTTITGLTGWRWLVFGVRSGREVVVSRRSLGTGSPGELFRYQEPEGEGPPDVAVSADGRLVGYTVGGLELNVRDLVTGTDDVLVSGTPRRPPPGADVAPPRWTIDDMNLTPAEQGDCTECGILALDEIRFSPSGARVAFGQRYYEGQNWGVIDRASRRYEPSGDAAGDLSWKTDDEIVTIGPFYAEDAEVRRATFDNLPASRGLVPERRLLQGSLSPNGDLTVLISDDPTTDQPVRLRVGILPIDGGQISRIDSSTAEKLTAGFTGDQTPVWIERAGLSGVLARQNTPPVPLPDDLYAFGPITPTGPDQIGLWGERRPDCSNIRPQPCEGPTPPFERRYLLVNTDDGTIAWQSPGLPADSTVAGLTR